MSVAFNLLLGKAPQPFLWAGSRAAPCQSSNKWYTELLELLCTFYYIKIPMYDCGRGRNQAGGPHAPAALALENPDCIKQLAYLIKCIINWMNYSVSCHPLLSVAMYHSIFSPNVANVYLNFCCVFCRSLVQIIA